MRFALGLDVDAVPAFAAILPLQSGARPVTLAASDHTVPTPGRIDSIIDATREVIADVTAREGEAPASVALVHPLAWDAGQVQRLHRALVRAELADVLVLTSAAAAAIGTDALHPVANGRRVTVVALRSDGAEVLALRKDGEHSFRELGAPTPVAGVTEGELDAILLSLVEAKLPGRLPVSREDPALQVAFAALGDAVHLARERLCSEDSAIVGVRLPGRAAVIQVQREEFQAAAAPLIATMLPALLAAIRQSGSSTGGVDRLILTGTSAPTPLLAELLTAELGVPVVVAGPRDSGSVGAAWAAGALAPDLPVAAPARAAAAASLFAAAPVAENLHPVLVDAAVPPTGAPVAAAATAGAPDTRSDDLSEVDPPSERRRRPLTLLQLWPITAAAAVLVALAGTVSSGVLDLTPAGSHPTSPATVPARSITTAPDAGNSPIAEPTSVAVTAPAAPATPDAGTTTKKKTGTKGSTSPAVPVVPVIPGPPSATPSPTSSPSDPPSTPPATDPPTDPPTTPPPTTP